MPRGRYPARLTIPPVDPALLERYRLSWPSRELYQHPEQFPPVTAAALFGVEAPLSLDLGCATGHFLCALAAREPGQCFLGIDTAGKPVTYAAAQAIERGLTNVRFLQADVMLILPLLRESSIANVYLHFPVPFHTTRRRKHLTYSPEVLQRLQQALVPGGRLSVVTDDAEVAGAVEQAAGQIEGMRLVAPGDWRLRLDDDLKSPYQRLWESRKRTIWRAELEKERDETTR